MGKANCKYGTYEEWISLIVEDGRFTASEIGVTVIAIHFKNASGVELAKAGRVSKSVVVSAKKKMREYGYVDVIVGGYGQGNRTLVSPTFPDGRVFVSVNDELSSGTNTVQKDFGNAVSGTDMGHNVPLNTTNAYHNVPQRTTKTEKNTTKSTKPVPLSGFSGTNMDHKDEIGESGPYIDNNITPPTPPPRDDGFSKSNFWGEVLNPTMHGEQSDVFFQNGEIILANGTRQKWLEKFGGSEDRLALALVEAAGRTRPGSNRPLGLQVEAILAAKVAQKMDQDSRYASAVKNNPRNGKQGQKPDGKSEIANILKSARG